MPNGIGKILLPTGFYDILEATKQGGMSMETITRYFAHVQSKLNEVL
jgi:hypothetical protein